MLRRRTLKSDDGAGRELSALASGLSRRSLASRIAIGTLKIAIPLVILVALAVGALLVRLQNGPMSVAPLKSIVIAGLQSAVPGFTPEFDDVLLARAPSGLGLRLQNLRFTDPDGRPVATAPRADIDLSLDGLKELRALPERITLVRPRITVFFSRDIGLSVSVAARATDPAAGTEAARDPGRPGAVPEAVTPRHVLGGSAPDGAVIADDGRLVVARALVAALNQSRDKHHAVGRLKSLGIRSATVLFVGESQVSARPLSLPRVDLTFERVPSGQRISGRVEAVTAGRPWSVNATAEQARSDAPVAITARFEGIDPARLGETIPPLAALKGFAGQSRGRIRIGLSETGALVRAAVSTVLKDIAIERSGAEASAASPKTLDEARVELSYDRARERITMAPSTFRWAGNSLTVIGSFARVAENRGPKSDWTFSVSGTDGRIALGDGRSTIPFSTLSARGLYRAEKRQLKIKSARLAAGGGSIALTGTLDTARGEPEYIFGEVGKVPLGLVGAIWPKGLAEETRAWFLANVKGGEITGGTVTIDRVASEPDAAGRRINRPRMFAAIDATNVKSSVLADTPVFEAKDIKLRIADQTLEITTPTAAAIVSGDAFTVTDVRYATARIWSQDYESEAAFKVDTTLPAALEMGRRPAFGMGLERVDLAGMTSSGAVTADVRLLIPNVTALSRGLSRVRALGTAALKNGAAKGGPFVTQDVSKADLTADLKADAVEVSGNLRLANAKAALNWDIALAGPRSADQARSAPNSASNKPPPLELRFTLDDAGRKRIGMQTGKLIQGKTPLTIRISDPLGERRTDVAMDLTPARIEIFSLNWEKPAGTPAALKFRVTTNSGGFRSLDDLTLNSENIAVSGRAVLDRNGQLAKFDLPRFTVDVVSQLKISGERIDVRGKSLPNWRIEASGRNFDGRKFFRGLFDAKRVARKPNRNEPGVDLTASLGRVNGFRGNYLKGVSLRLRKRAGQIRSLSLTGRLNDRTLAEAGIQAQQRRNGTAYRRLVVRSDDAGAMLAMMDFYTRAKGGRLRVSVDLDAVGPADKRGVARVTGFRVLGDPTLSKVLSTGGDTRRPAIAQGRGGEVVVREALDFDELEVPFAVGHGQLVIFDAQLRGPALGGTLRGKVDLTRKTLDLGGTYSMLQGLNAMPRFLPALGPLLTGTRGEGVLGLTFAIKGPTSQPEVIPNPLSVVAPGIFREFFQMAPLQPRVTPRGQGRPRSGSRPRTRRGTRRSQRSSRGTSQASQPKIIGGWTSETSRTPDIPPFDPNTIFDTD